MCSFILKKVHLHSFKSFLALVNTNTQIRSKKEVINDRYNTYCSICIEILKILFTNFFNNLVNMMIPPPSLMQNQFHQQQMSSPNIPPIMNHPKSFPMMQSQMQNQNMGNNNNSNNTNYNNNGNNNNNNNNTNNNINNSNKFNQINNQQPAKNPPALMSLMSLNPFGKIKKKNLYHLKLFIRINYHLKDLALIKINRYPLHLL